jgi:allantoin racemase
VSGFRLGLINPNTSAEHTAAMVAAAGEALGPDAKIVALTAERGPRAIESCVDDAVAAAEVVRMAALNPGLDAYLVGCFSDPALHAARELTTAPVVGIGEAAYHAASLVARRFAVITTLRRGVPALEDALAAHGAATRCVGIAVLDIPVAEQGAAHGATTEAIVEAAARAVEQDGAEAVLLACGGMADVELEVRTRVGVPATTGVAFGALLSHALWRSGLQTSAVGSFAPPEPIEYHGMASPREQSKAVASC